MRLLLYSSQFPTPQDPNGGIFTAQLGEAMARQAEVSVVCPIPWCPDTAWARRSQACRWYAGVPRSTQYGALPVYYPKYVQLPRISGPLQPMFQALGSFGLLRRLQQQGKIDAINAHWIYPDGVAATWMARRLGIPVMLTALGSDINVYTHYPWRRRQILWALQQANGVSAVSQALVTAIERLGVDPGKLRLIRNGVNTSVFSRADEATIRSLRRQLGLRDERKYLVFVGRLHPVKGLVHLLEALSLLHSRGNLNFDTILVGDGELRPELERTVAARDLVEQVRFTGEVAHPRVREWLQAGDAFCLPSLMEGMPNVVLEAQACGLPVVASRVGGLPEMVGPQAGILVEPAKPADLAEALERLFSKAWDREEIARAAGLQSWEAVASQYLAAVEGMSGHAGRG